MEIFDEIGQHDWALNPGETSDKKTEQFWDKSAEGFAKKSFTQEHNDTVTEILGLFDWKKKETVLDVACGPGIYSLLLAKKVAQITAIDFSATMLRQLKKESVRRSIDNITTVKTRWLDYKEPGRFDTVLAMNCLGVISTDSYGHSRLHKTLEKLMNLANERLIILIPHADSYLPGEILKTLGVDQVSLQRKRIALLYCAMVSCGMLPDLRIIDKPFTWTFKTLDEATDVLSKKVCISVKQELFLRDWLKSQLIYDDKNSCFCFSHSIAQALFIQRF